ncbi:MAG: hypothetical protein ACRC28_12755 [Clostridium sp.]|uniref:hypothetical protein n=1 Tax=Clostridium sp. TaxID=1506 RepID=UPI003F2B5CA3
MYFTTILSNSTEHIRCTGAIIRKSDLTIFYLKDEFINKIPAYEITINEVGNYLSLYEIHFNEVTFTLNCNKSKILTL